MTALFGQYSDERRDAIVDDLLKKRPAGGGDRAGIEFYTEHDYCDRYNQYRELFRCNKAYWGYTPLEVMRLGFTGSSGVEEYIIKRFYPGCDGRWNMTSGQKAGVARKANRIWDRIGDVARAKPTGRFCPRFVADSKEEAYLREERMISLLTLPVIASQESSSPGSRTGSRGCGGSGQPSPPEPGAAPMLALSWPACPRKSSCDVSGVSYVRSAVFDAK